MARICWLFMTFALLLGLSQTAHADGDIDLNTAGIKELVQLPGVGPKRAADIFRFRLRFGFRRPSDLLRIKGIGRRTYYKIRPLIRVGPPIPEAVVAKPRGQSRPTQAAEARVATK